MACCQDRSPIPFLPDDLLLMVFNELNTLERGPLAKTCKRFRNIDFELGKKQFDYIDIEWNQNEQSIIGKLAKIKYKIVGSLHEPIPDTHHTMRLFRKAKATRFGFSLSKATLTNNEVQLILTLLKIVTYKVLEFISRHALSEQFLGALIDGRNLAGAEVYIVWNGSQTNFFRQIPRMNYLSLINCEVDDETLIRIIFQIKRTYFNAGLCTAAGILNAFELYCTTTHNSERAQFSAKKSIVDELFSTTNSKFIKRENSLYYCNCDLFKLSFTNKEDDYMLEMAKRQVSPDLIIRKDRNGLLSAQVIYHQVGLTQEDLYVTSPSGLFISWLKI